MTYYLSSLGTCKYESLSRQELMVLRHGEQTDSLMENVEHRKQSQIFCDKVKCKGD